MIMNAILNLYRLQQTDSQIGQIEARLQAIQHTLEHDNALQSAQAQYDNAEKARLAAESSLRQSEGEVTSQKIKIDQAESSLYSGRVQSPKELQDMQKDIASRKRHLSTLEDRQLEDMLRLEEAQSTHASARANLGTVTARVESQNTALISERASLLQQLERATTERQAAHAALDSQNLALYERLRQQRRGVAVTTASEGACNACGAPLPPGLHQQAKTQLTHCPGCNRILFNSR